MDDVPELETNITGGFANASIQENDSSEDTQSWGH